jgi:peptide/nickel transport system permease protein
MIKLIRRRILFSIPLLFFVCSTTYFLEALIPGSIAQTILGINATPQEYAAVNHSLGLDLPFLQRYWNWIFNALHGHLGNSLYNSQPVSLLINQRLEATFSVVICCTLVCLIFGVTFGVISALRGGLMDRLLDGISAIGLAVPPFFLGVVLVQLLALKFHIFPAIGYVSLSHSFSGWFNSMTLPVVTLSLSGIAVITKQTRDAMRDVLDRPFIRTLKSNGVPLRSVVFKHALRNASIPVVTVVGLVFVGILSGTVLVETVFAIPGLGGLAVSATSTSDIPLIQGIVVYFTLIVIAVNLVVDILYGFLNPRIRNS